MTNPLLKPAILLSPVENGYVAYDTIDDRLHELNPTAALIVEMCDGTRSVDDIQTIVAPILPAAEVSGWIAGAIDAGLLSCDAPGVAVSGELSANELSKLARRLRENGKIQTAFICQQKAAELAENNPKMWSILAELAHIIGRRDRARSAYEKYLELRPDDAEVKHLLVALRNDAPPPRVPNECIEQLYRRFSTFYESNVCEELDYQGPARIREMIKAVLPERTELSVLDLGCGSGLAGIELKPRSSRLVGIDLSSEMVALARARNLYDSLEVAEITEWLDRTEDQFDLITACDCLIYFGDLRQVAERAAKRLCRGGAFIFTLERGDRYPFHLTDAGRYNHHPDHVREVSADAGLSVAHLDEGYLRMEYGSRVTGLFAVLKKSG